VEPATNA
jgi:hypothetical protein